MYFYHNSFFFSFVVTFSSSFLYAVSIMQKTCNSLDFSLRHVGKYLKVNVI